MKFWPFGKGHEGAAAAAAFDSVAVMTAALYAATKADTVDVEEVHFLMVLDDGSRETFALRGEAAAGKVRRATSMLDQVFTDAVSRGFFQFGKGGTMKWIPVSRVKQIITTVWPHEVKRAP